MRRLASALCVAQLFLGGAMSAQDSTYDDSALRVKASAATCR